MPLSSPRSRRSPAPRSLISKLTPLALIVLLGLIASACTPPAPAPTAAPTLIPASPVIPTDVPTDTPTATPIPAPARPQYSMNVALDYAAKSVSVDQTILYPNHTGQSLSDLLLAVEPNFWQGCFTLTGLSIDETAVTNYTLDGQKLDVPLPDVLPPGSSITLKLQYTLALPELKQQHGVRPQIFGYSGLQMNLTDWYPFVVPHMNGQWVLHDPGYYGEHLVYDAADFVVNVRPVGASTKLIIASSGAPEVQGDGYTYTLTAGRTFALSISDQFATSAVQVGDITVTSYYFPYYRGAGEMAMNVAAQSIQIYSQRFGPYPHKTLAVVMGDFNDGMEFSALFFMTRGAYNLFDGSYQNLTTAVAAHETAHQWWFEQVANDQAVQPWLDEALAAYCEHIYYETTHPDLLNWWWNYWPARVGGTDATTWLDTDIYSAGGFIPYTNGIYLRGAHFLDDLRQRIGDQAFFAFLQDYLAQENGKIATASDFFRILASHTSVDYSDVVRQYFQNVY